MNEYIDFRSDTVTKPTPEMRKAMAEAKVGDDVFRDDPTVNKLEAYTSQLLGKESAMFVPSGTFGNIVSILTHTLRGDEIIAEKNSHIFRSEVASAAVFGGVQCHTVDGINGVMSPEAVKSACRNPSDIHQPPTRLICLENAHSLGTVLPMENMRDMRRVADEYGLLIHIDGARLFNASTTLQVEAKEIAGYSDSIQICLSKGLCAPVGSLVLGTKEFIEKARKYRKMLGGGMRQAGILAAAGLISLEKMTGRLNVDHINARYLADRLQEFDGINVFKDRLEINMVFFTADKSLIPDPADFELRMASHGFRIRAPQPGACFRFMTHNDISKEDIDRLIETMRKVLVLKV